MQRNRQIGKFTWSSTTAWSAPRPVRENEPGAQGRGLRQVTVLVCMD